MRTRYRVEHDQAYQFEECDGGPMPMSAEAYAANAYRACPDHLRAGSKDLQMTPIQIQGCKECGRPSSEYIDIPYEEYCAYYGNPDRHVVLRIEREDECPCCGNWAPGKSINGIDMMDTDDWETGTLTLKQLPGYLRECAEELDPAEMQEAHA